MSKGYKIAFMNAEPRRFSDLITLFNRLFRESYQTELVKGEDEPLYQPAINNDGSPHQIIFAHGYFSSALHEISHWCIAGKERRMLLDYGYWYEPDGRSPDMQREFELVEVKPQALEWIFAAAAGHPFHVSIDNLGGVAYNRPEFENNVRCQALKYLRDGLPDCARRFTVGLLDFYRGGVTLADLLREFEIRFGATSSAR